MHGLVNAKPLLNPAQRMLYGRLVRAFPGHIIMARVALSRALVADFVVFRADFTALAAVELDDSAKARRASRERYRRRDQILQGAGIKVIRLPADDIPHESALKALVAALPLKATPEQLMRRAS
jgi:very-short-patch-repair endonuclease